MDLSLISMDDLTTEMFRRKEACIIAYIDYEGGDRTTKCAWDGDFIDVNGLVNISFSSGLIALK